MRLKNYKILVVDDDPDLLDLLADGMRMNGAQVMTAEGGFEAIKLINQIKFDLVISDMRMPAGDGRDLAKFIKSITSPKPILFIYSGYNDLQESEVIEWEIKYLFSKPFDFDELIDKITSFLEK